MENYNMKDVTALGGRCCDVRAAAKRNAKQMTMGGSEKNTNLHKKYKDYADLIV